MPRRVEQMQSDCTPKCIVGCWDHKCIELAQFGVESQSTPSIGKPCGDATLNVRCHALRGGDHDAIHNVRFNRIRIDSCRTIPFCDNAVPTSKRWRVVVVVVVRRRHVDAQS
jgi:hypothetical protein